MAKSNSTARPACPTDVTLPQTKYAQKLKPYEGELPSYIRAMDECASRAGLTIRHLRDGYRDTDYIVLVYSGTREQIGRYGLSRDGKESIHWPSGTKVPSRFILHKLAPSRFEQRGSLFKINEERYAIEIKECLPRAISNVLEGFECFDFTNSPWGYVAYVGEKEKMISEGVAADICSPMTRRRKAAGLTARKRPRRAPAAIPWCWRNRALARGEMGLPQVSSTRARG